MTEPTIAIEYLSGQCPVQAEGIIDGKRFYFRSRGAYWELGIGDEPIGNPSWTYGEDYGNWPDAGYISEDEALRFLLKAARIFHQRADDE